MDINHRSKRLTIVEGCDSGGKSTFAKQFAAETDAQYVHFGPLKGVKHGLARLYVEAMTPALLGIRDVVFDRSWLSEQPYGDAYRDGADRLGCAQVRMLERLALRCGAVVVYCRPPWTTVQNNFLSRTKDEYLPNTTVLKDVYDSYVKQTTDLTSVVYDYTSMDTPTASQLDQLRTPRHLTIVHSAGNAEGRCVLIGEAFAELSDEDPWYRWPFGSFSGRGCSRWLTEQLQSACIPERELFWVNVDQLARLPSATVSAFFPSKTTLIALGLTTSTALWNHKIPHLSCEHPQSHKRFKSGIPYELTAMIQHALSKGTLS